MSIFTRSTRQRSKPVIIDLRRTDLGFEPIDERQLAAQLAAKAIPPKPERPIMQAKTLSNKSLEGRNVASPSVPTPGGDMLMRSRTAVNPMMNNPRPMMNNGMPGQDRQLLGRPGGDMVRRELQPYSSMSQPRMENGITTELGYGNSLSMGGSGLTAGHHESAYAKQMEKVPQKKFSLAIPSCSHWFDIDHIHQIEKEALPEFFCGKANKTPESYMRIRNFMINLYMQTPAHYLTSSICRKSLAGDTCAVIRVHTFLERWGLINFYIDPNNYPRNIFLNKPNCKPEKNLEFVEKGKIGLFDLTNGNTFKNNEDNVLAEQLRLLDKNNKPTCDFCGDFCGVEWFRQKTVSQYNQENNTLAENDKENKLTLCKRCYTNEDFPKVLSQTDFYEVKPIDQIKSHQTKVQTLDLWTTEETHLLLESIQELGDRWNEIQKRLPHKTKDEIIAHYLRLPTNYITPINILENGENKGHEDNINDRMVDQVPTVFGDTSNPVLQHVAIFKTVLQKYKEQKRAKELAEEMVEEQALKETKAEDDGERNVEVQKIEEGVEGALQSETKPNEEAMKIEKEVEHVKTNPPHLNGNNIEIETKKEESNQQNPIGVEAAGDSDKKDESSKTNTDILVELQIKKLDLKVDYFEDFEKLLTGERKQNDFILQSFISEKVDLAYKRAEQTRPIIQQQQQQAQMQQQFNMPANPIGFEPKDPGYPPFNPNPPNFNTDSLMDIGGDGLDSFS